MYDVARIPGKRRARAVRPAPVERCKAVWRPQSGGVDAVPNARKWVRAHLRDWECTHGWGCAFSVDDVELTASELVTNAVRHGGGVRAVVMALDADARIVVRVLDNSCLRPVLASSSDADGGRGMLLVAALAHMWGVDSPAMGGGKAVWACFPTRPPSRGSEQPPKVSRGHDEYAGAV